MKNRSGRIEIIPYRSNLVEKARKLRNSATSGEKHLWKYISGKQMYGYDFDRQTSIDNYIVDFCCKELKLVIELDGRYHDFKVEYDEQRQKRMESFGVQVIRFEEKKVLENIDQVLAEIRYWVLEREKTVKL